MFLVYFCKSASFQHDITSCWPYGLWGLKWFSTPQVFLFPAVSSIYVLRFSCGFPVAFEGLLCLFSGGISSHQRVCIYTVITVLHANTRHTLMSDTVSRGTKLGLSLTHEFSVRLHVNIDLQCLNECCL